MKTPSAPRLLALLTVGTLAATALLQPAPAQAADKAKNYKYGAIALGVAGAYLLSKGKTAEAAAVLGVGAYTYKKGEDARKSEKDERERYDGRYGYNDPRNNDRYPDARYPDPRPNDNRYDSRYDGRDDARYPTVVSGSSDKRNGDYRARNDNPREERDRSGRDERGRDVRVRDDVRVR